MKPQNVKIVPCQGFLLVEINELPSETLVALPDNKHQYPYGEVLAVGPDEAGL